MEKNLTESIADSIARDVEKSDTAEVIRQYLKFMNNVSKKHLITKRKVNLVVSELLDALLYNKKWTQ